MTPSVNPHGRPLIGRPTTLSTGHLAGAFESSSRFEGASEMASNTIILMDRIPLACMIVSLGCLLIDRSLGGAMDSVYGEREAIAGRRATACESVRRRRLLRWLTRRKISPRYQTLRTDGAPEPPEASGVQDDDGGGPCAVSDGAEAATMVQSYWTAF